MINSHSNGVQRGINHYGFAQFFLGCPFYPAAAYVPYQRPAEIDWSSFRLSNCWFLYTFIIGRIHRLSAAEVKSHKDTVTGETSPSQMLAACVVIWVGDESNQCVNADPVANFGLPLRSDETAPPCLLLCLASLLLVDVLCEDLDAKSDWDSSDTFRLASSGFVPVPEGTYSSSKGRATNSRATVRLTPRSYFDWRWSLKNTR